MNAYYLPTRLYERAAADDVGDSVGDAVGDWAAP